MGNCRMVIEPGRQARQTYDFNTTRKARNTRNRVVEFNGVATDPWGNEKAGFEATADINRTDWGLTWNANLEKGGVLVSEKIKLVLDVQLAKQA